MFKVGDAVRVRKDLVVGKKYGDYILYPALIKFIGEKVVINEITWQGLYACYSETNNNWQYFSPEMLEPISKTKEYTLIVTDKKVIILDKENKKKGLAECHEDDVFQFEVGAKLAWDRLHGIKEKKIDTPKPVECKLYDCNGVELKEGDEVKSICLYNEDVFENTIIKGVDGVLYNSGMSGAHRADKNGGMYDRTKSYYNWRVIKVTK